MANRIILISNSFVLLITGIGAVFFPSSFLSLLGVSLEEGGTIFVRIIGGLLLLGALLSLRVVNAGASKARDTITLIFSIGWFAAFISFMLSLEAGITGGLAYAYSAIGIILGTAFLFLVFDIAVPSPAQSGQRPPETQIKPRSLLLTLGVAAVITVLFSVYLPFIWRLVFKADPPDSISAASNSTELIITLFALTAAVVGGSFYIYLRDAIERKVLDNAKQTTSRALAKAMGRVGYSLWMFYTEGTGTSLPMPPPPTTNMIYLKEAIRLTWSALDKEVPKLKLPDHPNEEIKCTLMNNWAFYVAERYEKEGRTTVDAEDSRALQYADYIQEKLSDHPDHGAAWSHTASFVKEKIK